MRDLNGTHISNVTVEDCLEFCFSNSFSYAGLQNGSECYCDKNFGLYGAASDSGCTLPCILDETESCGGLSLNMIFKLKGVNIFSPSFSGFSRVCKF
jgi:hypothetical protein